MNEGVKKTKLRIDKQPNLNVYELVEHYENKINNLQNRIDKAIEYLYEHSQYNDADGVRYIKEDEYCVDYLLDILKERGE